MNKKIFLVTGANKGIGYGIVNGLLKQKIKNNIVILSSRNEQLGIEAVKQLKATHKDMIDNIDYLKLDIDNITDIRLAENYINNKYGYLSVLVNNAGYLNRNPGFQNSNRASDIIKTFSTNFFSQVFLTESLIHLIKKDKESNNPQILFTSSVKGQRTFNDNKLNERLSDGNINNLEQFYKEYLNAANNGKLSDFKYKDENEFFSYGVSKMFLISYMANLSNRLKEFNIKVNSFNPGWVRTDMGGNNASLSIEEGCETLLWMISNYSLIKSGFVYENKELVEF